MRGIVEASISGWQSEVSHGTTFDPKDIKTIVGGIAVLSTAFGYPGLFQDSIQKICSVVIHTQRLQMSGGLPKSSWTSVTILSLLLPSAIVRRMRLPEYENLVYEALPSMDALPRRVVSCYHIACSQNEKMAEIDKVSTIDLERVIGKSPLSNAKSSKPDDSSLNSQDLRLTFSQSSPMESD